MCLKSSYRPCNLTTFHLGIVARKVKPFFSVFSKGSWKDRKPLLPDLCSFGPLHTAHLPALHVVKESRRPRYLGSEEVVTQLREDIEGFEDSEIPLQLLSSDVPLFRLRKFFSCGLDPLFEILDIL